MALTPKRAGIKVSEAIYCEKAKQLLYAFGWACHELIELHSQQFRAVVDGDLGSERFDILIYVANERKRAAKYAYLRHLEFHGCSNVVVSALKGHGGEGKTAISDPQRRFSLAAAGEGA